MRRLWSAIRWEVRLQFRNGFYYAAGFVAVLFIIGLQYLPAAYWPLAMPVLVMGNMTMNTFYFMAALVLLEKDDGVLTGLVLTPLRQGEYLWAKLLSLALLTLVENGVIVTAVVVTAGVGVYFNPLLMAAGIVLLSFINALYSFMLVIRYESVNSFIFPSVFWAMVLSIPLLQYFGLVDTPLMYLHPVQAPLLLLTGAFQPMPAWTWLYGVVYGAVWVAILYRLARRAFYRFVILPRGLAM